MLHEVTIHQNILMQIAAIFNYKVIMQQTTTTTTTTATIPSPLAAVTAHVLFWHCSVLAMSSAIGHSAIFIINPHQKVQCMALANCVIGANLLNLPHSTCTHICTHMLLHLHSLIQSFSEITMFSGTVASTQFIFTGFAHATCMSMWACVSVLVSLGPHHAHMVLQFMSVEWTD